MTPFSFILLIPKLPSPNTDLQFSELLYSPLQSYSMPPPLTTNIFYTFIFLILTILHCSSEASHSCAHIPEPSKSHPPCPPFPSTPPYPFSPYPSCGHPSFPTLHCSHPHSTLTINHHRFNLLHYSPNSTSLLLSLISSNTSSASCSSSSSSSHLPTRPISLSNSPFRISSSSCARLNLLQPCPNSNSTNLPNCTHCPFQCQLIKNPTHLLQDCGSELKRSNSDQGCQSDVLDYIHTLTSQFGFEIEWDEHSPYFTSCKQCQSNHGACGFDSTSPKQAIHLLPCSLSSPLLFFLCHFLIIGLFIFGLLKKSFLIKTTSF